MRCALVVVGAAFLVAALAAPAFAQPPDPWVGTWRLNSAKSKYTPGPAPQELARHHYGHSPGGIKQTTADRAAHGSGHGRRSVRGGFRREGLPGHREIPMPTCRPSLKIDSHSYQIVSKKGGKVTITSKVVVSARRQDADHHANRHRRSGPDGEQHDRLRESVAAHRDRPRRAGRRTGGQEL